MAIRNALYVVTSANAHALGCFPLCDLQFQLTGEWLHSEGNLEWKRRVIFSKENLLLASALRKDSLCIKSHCNFNAACLNTSILDSSLLALILSLSISVLIWSLVSFSIYLHSQVSIFLSLSLYHKILII